MRTHRQNWLDVFSTFRVALDIRKMILGAFGVMVTIVLLFAIICTADTFCWPSCLDNTLQCVSNPQQYLGETIQAISSRYMEALAHPFRLPSAGSGLAELVFVDATIILMLLWWGFIGGAICRMAAVDFARDQRLSVSEACSFSRRKMGSLFWSPLLPILFITILLACNAFLGLLGRIPTAGPVLLGLGYWLATISSFLIVLIAIGGYFGMIFMWPTIAMEGTDTFDAVSRSFAYLYSRPWKTAWCVLVVWIYGVICMAFVAGFTYMIIRIAQVSVNYGLGDPRPPLFGAMSLLPRTFNPDAPFVEKLGAGLVFATQLLIGGLFLGFLASFKLSAMTLIYAVIRRDVDGVDMSEVFLPESDEIETGEATESASEGKNTAQ